MPVPGRPREWTELVTCDVNPDHHPDVIHDLESLPWPWSDNSFDEIHAYEVLEHLGRLGDERSFFAHFYELWRILKPGGHLCGTSPAWGSIWMFGDPGHKREISSRTFRFLSQKNYQMEIGKTAMTDYRYLWRGDFEPVILVDDSDGTFLFILKAIKEVAS